MYVAKKEAEILSYGLTENDYKNYFNEIDPDRLQHHRIEYDEDFITEYLERLKYLNKCLREGRMP
jgi:hypothetical protein